MNRLEEHRAAYRYNRWAMDRTFDAVAVLDPALLDQDLGSSFPTLAETLRHIQQSEWVWLRRWKGTSPHELPEGWESLPLPGIRREWEAVDAERAEFLERLEERDLDRELDYSSFAGEPRRHPLWQLLRHVVNHSSYHRGQVVTMLRQLGEEAVGTDMVRFFDS
ncbi:MAG TPA: DinB family protein [Longimicrobiales bacterium]|nr:DinB family protein [Longimicrobiales bacterium]